jgi:Ran-binding protein 3
VIEQVRIIDSCNSQVKSAIMSAEGESAQAAVGNQTTDASDPPKSPLAGSSDGEGERTTREKLKKTSIAGLSQKSQPVLAEGDSNEDSINQVSKEVSSAQNGNQRGRPSKKRSFEELQKHEHTVTTENGSIDPARATHKRMRSREITHDDGEAAQYEHQEVGSPLEEETDAAARGSPGGPGVIVDANTKSDTNAQSAQNSERVEDDGGKTAKISEKPNEEQPAVSNTEPDVPVVNTAASEGKAPSALSPTSGFANTSSTSPFGAKSPPAATEPVAASTSASAFASSGLASFASAEKSPFGASSSLKSGGGFGGASSGFGGGSVGFAGAAPVSSFGSAPSPFAAKGGFGGSSFSGTTIGGAKGFGGGSAPKAFGAPPARFGSKSKDDDDAEESANEEEQPSQPEEEQQDSRFHQQDRKFLCQGVLVGSTNIETVETGEEGERSVFSARAKLYHFVEKQWKERGTGLLKLNIRYEKVQSKADEGDDEDGDAETTEIKARVIMRADGVHRVILNSPVFEGMKNGTQEGNEPTGKTMFLTGMDEGHPRLFQIKVSTLLFQSSIRGANE